MSKKYKKKPQVVFLVGDGKSCAKCKETKPLDGFRKSKAMYCGYDSWCKVCRTRDQQASRERQCSTTLGHLTFAYERTKRACKYDGKEFNLSLEYLLDLYLKQEGKCALSDVVLTTGQGQGIKTTALSIDRIDSSKGYIEGNVHFVCYIVNIMKNTLTLEELASWCQKITTKLTIK